MKIRWWNFFWWKKIAKHYEDELAIKSAGLETYSAIYKKTLNENGNLRLQNCSQAQEIERLNNLLTPKRTEAPRDSKVRGWASRV